VIQDGCRPTAYTLVVQLHVTENEKRTVNPSFTSNNHVSRNVGVTHRRLFRSTSSLSMGDTSPAPHYLASTLCSRSYPLCLRTPSAGVHGEEAEAVGLLELEGGQASFSPHPPANTHPLRVGGTLPGGGVEIGRDPREPENRSRKKRNI